MPSAFFTAASDRLIEFHIYSKVTFPISDNKQIHTSSSILPSASIAGTTAIQQQPSIVATPSAMTMTSIAKPNTTPVVVSANTTTAPNKTISEASPDNTVIEVSAENGQPAPTNLNETLANSKEKTPMCLVNELARFNKVGQDFKYFFFLF